MMRIMPSGSLGVGTTSPAFTIDVAGQARSFCDVGALWTNAGQGSASWINLGTLSGTSRYKLEIMAGTSYAGGSGSGYLTSGIMCTIMCTIGNAGGNPNIQGDYWNIGNDSGGVNAVKFVQGTSNTIFSVYLSLSLYPLVDVKVHGTGSGGTFVPNAATAGGATASDPGTANTTIISAVSRMQVNATTVQTSAALTVGGLMSTTAGISATGTMNWPVTGTSSAISWGAGPGSKIYDDGDLRISTDDYMHFYTGLTASSPGTERMTIYNNGYVGINQTAPSFQLDVNGTARVANTFTLTGTAGSLQGGHLYAYTTADTYPLFHQLNWGHDNVSLNFDMYFNGSNWTSSSSSVAGYQLYKNGSAFTFYYYPSAGAGNTTSSTGIMQMAGANVNFYGAITSTFNQNSSNTSQLSPITTSLNGGPQIQSYNATGDRYGIGQYSYGQTKTLHVGRLLWSCRRYELLHNRWWICRCNQVYAEWLLWYTQCCGQR